MFEGIKLLQDERQYRKLFLSGVVNGIGDRFSQVAILALLLNLTGSGVAVGITLAIRVIPFLLFGTLGGILADQFSRKKILIMTDLARIMFALSFLFVNSKDDLWIVYVSTFILAAGEAIYAPTRKSSIPLLIKDENILKINSLEQVALGIVLIVGAFSGGVVSYFFGPDATFWFNGLSFLLAAFLINTIHFPNEIEPETAKSSVEQSSFKKLFLASNILQIIILIELLVPLFDGVNNVLISVYAIEEFGLGDIGVGLFYGALGIGLTLSFTISKYLHKNLIVVGFTMLLLEGLLFVLLSRVNIVFLAFLIFCCVSLITGIGNTCFDTVVMRETPREKQGFVFGILTTLSNTLIGISMFSAGLALEIIEPRLLGMIGGIGFVLIGLLLFIYSKFRFRGNLIS